MAECPYINTCPIYEKIASGVLEEIYMRQYCKNDYKSCKRYQARSAGKTCPDHMMPDGTGIPEK